MSLLNRIKIKAKEQGLTIPGIEEKLSFGKNSMYRWDTNSPSVNKVALVANLLNISVEYLITGNTRSDINTNDDEVQDLVQKYKNLSMSDKNKIDMFIEIASLKDNYAVCNDTDNKSKKIVMEDIANYNMHKKYVPLLRNAAAGIPIALVKEYVDQVEAPSDKADFATTAKGTGMEPVIFNGENIFIKSMQNLDNGDIGVFEIDGEATCKIFKYDAKAKTAVLTSFNSAYKPLNYLLKNYQDIFRIVGKVILTDEQDERYRDFIGK